ncbi:MAG TPA: UvrD-helicase domain-containing protein [Alphaproteobacteria bacterium]
MSDPYAIEEAPAPGAAPVPAARAEGAYLRALNPVQREAVETTEGALLVLAGAGTGKTRVLTTRLAHILIAGKAFPGQVLAVTFTNKAAREMGARVAGLLGRAADGLWLGTFHAIATRILRRHAELAGLQSGFTILDADDQLRLLKQVMQAANLDDKRWPARGLMNLIQRWKDRGLAPDKVPAGDDGGYAAGQAVALYRAYQQRLAALNACDFGDLLLHCLTLFTRHADVLAEYQRRFKYILVDEYQDTNVAQYLWLRLLAQGHRNICCVGDDDQSIYSWRGAEVGNILRFEKDFPGAKIIRLEQNYRSTPEILAAASGLIAKNVGRLGKTLWTENGRGAKVRVRAIWDGEAEARAIAEEIEVLRRDGESLDGIAVLVRAGFQMREFEERFMTVGLPYRVVGGPRFYERAEIRDAIAYLRVIAQPSDDLAFERIVNVPKRGIGDATMHTVHALARAESVPLLAAAGRLAETDELKPQARAALRRLAADFARWRALAETVDQVELAETVLEESGYTDMWKSDKSPDAPGRLENLKELTTAMEEFENLAGFLEHVSLVMENEGSNNGERASLMTLHAAKGLEFDTVFLPGWEEGLFPHQRTIDDAGSAGLEEERRLAYVGLTRAKKRAAVSFVANRRVHNQWTSAIPSRFVDELPAEHVEVVSDSGLYSGAAVFPGAGGFANAGAAYDWDRRSTGRGPGFDRLRSARTRRDLVIEGAARPVRNAAAEGLAVGSRVFHQKFGYGRVRAAEGDKLEIEFDKAGRKKVLASFVAAA